MMIYPELKRLHSPDVYDLENYQPKDERCFGFLLQAMFRQRDGREDEEESFDMIVCTPAWLDLQLKENEAMSLRHHLLVRKYDFKMIKDFLIAYAEKCAGENWHEVALKLGRIGWWEFEDYQPFVEK